MKYRKKALVIDLDNTIYPVSSIGEKLLAPLFDLILSSASFTGNPGELKKMLMRKPFQFVALHYQLDKQTIGRAKEILSNLVYNKPIEPFADYKFVKELPIDKFLVTTGFTRLQRSKLEHLGITGDFKHVFIVDPETSAATKQSVFRELVTAHGYSQGDLLVIGDDPESEIRAAQNLGIDAVLYDKAGLYVDIEAVPRITDFEQLERFLK